MLLIRTDNTIAVPIMETFVVLIRFKTENRTILGTLFPEEDLLKLYLNSKKNLCGRK